MFPFLCPSRGQLPPVGWGRSVVITCLDNRWRCAERSNVSRTESTERDQPVAGRVRRACDDAPLSFYLLRAETSRDGQEPRFAACRRLPRVAIS